MFYATGMDLLTFAELKFKPGIVLVEVRFGLEGLCDARDVIGFEGHRGVDVAEKKTEK